MKITEDDRKYAAEHIVAVDEALKKGMEAEAKEVSRWRDASTLH